jgi:hypothetical protein
MLVHYFTKSSKGNAVVSSENVGSDIKNLMFILNRSICAPLIHTGPKTCYELTCPLLDRHLKVSSLDEKPSLHVQVPSKASSMKQLEDCRLLQSDSSKHCPLVAVTDQNGYKDLTVVTMQITVF